MTVKKQHYVPQFYLRNFSKSNNKKVNIYRKNDQKYITASVRSICYSKYYYDLEDNDLIKKYLDLIKELHNIDFNAEKLLQDNPQYVETIFLNRLESESSKVIKKILNSENGIILQNIEVRLMLLIFFYNLHERSPFKRDRYENLYNQMVEAYNKISEPYRSNLFENYLFNPKELQIKNMINVENLIIDYATKYEWTLGVTNESNKIFTSDNPAWALYMNEFCFPISTSKAILIRPKSPNQRKHYTDKKNKKYVTNFSEGAVFINNTFQNAHSNLLIGSHDSISKYLSTVKSLQK